MASIPNLKEAHEKTKKAYESAAAARSKLEDAAVQSGDYSRAIKAKTYVAADKKARKLQGEMVSAWVALQKAVKAAPGWFLDYSGNPVYRGMHAKPSKEFYDK